VARTLTGPDLVIASHNEGKVAEIALLLAPLGLRLTSARDRSLPEPEEGGATFVANVSIKALAAAWGTGVPAIADDSGLVVPALGGAPGVRSARWGGPARDFGAAMRKVHEALGTRARDAEMVAALAIAWPDGHVEAREGRVRGTLVWPPRGALVFGYEPMFLPDGETRTYGEMSRADKSRDDPRARAYAGLVGVLRGGASMR